LNYAYATLESEMRVKAISEGIVTLPRACGILSSRLAKRMKKISYRGYRFPPEIIHQAIWLYLRFTLSLRDVEDLLAERGVALSAILRNGSALGESFSDR
jgi:predicted HTH domain antitoxin